MMEDGSTMKQLKLNMPEKLSRSNSIFSDIICSPTNTIIVLWTRHEARQLEKKSSSGIPLTSNILGVIDDALG